MKAMQNALLRIPDHWSPTWFRNFMTDIVAPGDVRNAIGDGIAITSPSSNSPATLSVSGSGAASIATHNVDPLAHTQAFTGHRAEADPHPVYATRGESESLAFFLGE